jgi:hypothetical protein
MSAIVQVRVLDGKKWVTKRVQLLGGNVIPDADDGFIRYDFQPLMREIVTPKHLLSTVTPRAGPRDRRSAWSVPGGC